MANLSKCVEMNRRTDVDIQSIETFHVIWLITNVNDEMALTKENEIMKLRRIVNYYKLFNDRDACIDYITEGGGESIKHTLIAISTLLNGLIRRL
jgi:hypothetical protein